MAESFAQGLASGLEAGTGLALQKNQQQFEQGLQTQELALKQTAAQREGLQSQLSAIQLQRQNLGNTIGTRLQANPQGLPPDEMDSYKQQKALLDSQQNTILQHMGGADLTQFAAKQEKTGQDLASGYKDISDLLPKETYDFVTHHASRPAEDYIDTPGRPSPVGENFRKIHQGIQNLPNDNGQMLLDGLNAQYGHTLQGLVGKTAGDGVSTVVGAKFAPPVPHPGDPSNLIPTVHLTIKGPHGEIVDQAVPVMDDHGQILAHPDDRADAMVKHLGLNDIFDHIGADETLYKAINSSPDIQNKILQTVNDGKDDEAKSMLAMAQQLGGDPSKWLPPQGESVIDESGNVIYRGKPGEKVSTTLGAAQLRGQYAQAAAQTRASEAMTLGLARIAAGQNSGLQPVIVNGQAFGFNPHTNTYTPSTGLNAGEVPVKVGGAGLGGAVDPAAVENTAKMMADGQIPYFTGSAMRSPFAQAVVKRINEINPSYSAADQPAQAKAEKDFATGKQGNAVRSFNVAISHLDTLGQLSDALNNGDIRLFNKIGNTVASETGAAAPTDFNAAKKIVGDEIVKAIVGSGGGVADREEASKTIDAANSPAQLKSVIDTYKTLMNGQLGGLRLQYKQTVGKDDFDRFLSPKAKAAGASSSVQNTPPLGAKIIRYDANGQRIQ